MHMLASMKTVDDNDKKRKTKILSEIIYNYSFSFSGTMIVRLSLSIGLHLMLHDE